jgi:hypothetical protein
MASDWNISLSNFINFFFSFFSNLLFFLAINFG